MSLCNFQRTINELAINSNLRFLPIAENRGKYVDIGGQLLLNFTSNDYLGLGIDVSLRDKFYKNIDIDKYSFTSSSSRLLGGKIKIYEELENLLCSLYCSEAALIFNSGYHMNVGIIPAISNNKTLIVADKFVHASIIDGIILSRCNFFRYRHNDYEHLEDIIKNNYNLYEQIIIVTESIFSMDGDKSDILKLVEIKNRYPNILLYIDEAHAVGVVGKKGLGVAEECECISEIDFLVGTFGKAIASVGAFVVCKEVVRNFLINKMRSFIFSTALPPINILWTFFIMNNLINYNDKRILLNKLSEYFNSEIKNKGYVNNSKSQIIPVIVKENKIAIEKSNDLLKHNIYVLAVRPPTVPEGTARLRFSLNASMNFEEIKSIIKYI